MNENSYIDIDTIVSILLEQTAKFSYSDVRVNNEFHELECMLRKVWVDHDRSQHWSLQLLRVGLKGEIKQITEDRTTMDEVNFSCKTLE